MTTFQKVRLCTIILSAEKNVRAGPIQEWSNPKCILREIHFENYTELHYHDDYDQWWERAVPVEEWMLACKATRIQNNEPVIRYISRGFKANTFFVSRVSQEADNVTVLESIVSRIGVVPAAYL